MSNHQVKINEFLDVTQELPRDILEKILLHYFEKELELAFEPTYDTFLELYLCCHAEQHLMETTSLYDNNSEEITLKMNYFNRVSNLSKERFLRYRSDLKVANLLALSRQFLPSHTWEYYESFLSNEDFFHIYNENGLLVSKAIKPGRYLISAEEFDTILSFVRFPVLETDKLDEWYYLYNDKFPTIYVDVAE